MRRVGRARAAHVLRRECGPALYIACRHTAPRTRDELERGSGDACEGGVSSGNSGRVSRGRGDRVGVGAAAPRLPLAVRDRDGQGARSTRASFRGCLIRPGIPPRLRRWSIPTCREADCPPRIPNHGPRRASEAMRRPGTARVRGAVCPQPKSSAGPRPQSNRSAARARRTRSTRRRRPRAEPFGGGCAVPRTAYDEDSTAPPTAPTPARRRVQGLASGVRPPVAGRPRSLPAPGRRRSRAVRSPRSARS